MELVRVSVTRGRAGDGVCGRSFTSILISTCWLLVPSFCQQGLDIGSAFRLIVCVWFWLIMLVELGWLGLTGLLGWLLGWWLYWWSSLTVALGFGGVAAHCMPLAVSGPTGWTLIRHRSQHLHF